ncbi:MAG TPA: hypothetical protein VI074_03130 [Propionibacteriaceae bacterium]
MGLIVPHVEGTAQATVIMDSSQALTQSDADEQHTENKPNQKTMASPTSWMIVTILPKVDRY